MKEVLTIFSPQWWSFKNRLLRSHWTAYVKFLCILALGGGLWFIALHFIGSVLARMQGMEGGVSTIIALKGLSLVMMLVFFLLLFSSLLTGINTFYLSNDLPVLLSSPVSWDSIFFSKWLETAIKSSWMILLAILPVFAAFGIFFKASAVYYLCLFPILVMFVLVPSGLGVFVSILLMAVVPARRAKNVFIILGLLMTGILFLLFRLLQPERFANPEWFANLTIFLSEIKLPVSVFLPSMWTTEALMPFFNAEGGAPLFYASLLFFTAAAFMVFGNRLFNAFYYEGLVKAQISQRPWLTATEDPRGIRGLLSPRTIYLRMLKIIPAFFRGYRAALIEKDVMTFFRNIGQSSQMLLLFAIIIIYLFSIKALPVEWDSYLSLKLRYIISFFNIGLVGFVITAVATRFVLPSVENEGRAFWIIRVSPVSMKQFLWSKFFIAFFPLLGLAQLLIVISNIFLGVQIWFIVLGTGTCLVLSASVAGLAVGTGAYNARFSLDDKDKDQSGLKGTAYMLLAFTVIAATIMLEIIPAGGMFMKEITSGSLTLTGWMTIVLPLIAVLVFNVLVLWMSMRMGEKRLVSLE